MTRYSLIILFLILLMAVSFSARLAVAQDESDTSGHFERLLALCDANKDGKVSLDENKAAHVAAMAAIKAAGDDAEKLDSVYERFAVMIELREFLEADADDDHQLTGEEWQLQHDRTYTMHAMGPPRMCAADEELLAADEVEQFWAEFAPFDADGDGKASKGELRAFALHQIREARRAADNDPNSAHPVNPDGPLVDPAPFDPADFSQPEGDLVVANAAFSEVGRSWTMSTTTVDRNSTTETTTEYLVSAYRWDGPPLMSRRAAARVRVTRIADGVRTPLAPVEVAITGSGRLWPEGEELVDGSVTREEISTPAGTFSCIRRIFTQHQRRITRWESLDLRGLVVKEVNDPEPGVMTPPWRSVSEVQTVTDPRQQLDQSVTNAGFTVVGRTWVVTRTQRSGGSSDIVVRRRFTVKQVDGDTATLAVEAAEGAGAGNATTRDVELSGRVDPDWSSGLLVEFDPSATVTTAAGKFACVYRVWSDGNRVIERWTSIDYPGLVVKETNSPTPGVMTAQWTRELEMTEFSSGANDD